MARQSVKKWYYGPGRSQDVLHVFGSTSEPTETTWGGVVKYAVGPFKTRKQAVHRALTSQAHPGWRVYIKLKGPYSLAVPRT